MHVLNKILPYHDKEWCHALIGKSTLGVTPYATFHAGEYSPAWVIV
jgi:hypothetical protein